MPIYHPAIHHRRSIRLKGYDYTAAGAYFITICCHHHLPLFGEIVNGEMHLNKCGKIAYQEWLNTNNKRSNIGLGEFVIMPNHLHGIIFIHKQINPNRDNADTDIFHSPSNDIPAIIRGYKAAVTRQLKGILKHSPWQRNYFEHIIRNEQSYHKITQYIYYNPQYWQNDCFYIQP